MSAMGQDSVEKWLSRMAKTTARNSRFGFRVWMDWLREHGGDFKDKTPDELIQFQREASNSDRYEILDVIQRYVNGIEGARIGTMLKAYSMIRSFFAHNRAELPRDPTFIVRSDVEKVRGTLSVEEIRDIVLSSKTLYRAVFLSIFQGGMGLEEFSYWNTHGLQSLRDQLQRNPEVIRIELPGRKRRKNKDPYYTFIGRDAIEAIRDYLRIRPEGGQAIFLNQFRDPVSSQATTIYWSRHLVKLGFIIPTPEKRGAARYGKNMHEIRDVFRSQWEKSPAKASVAEFLMGHVVDPLEYNKAHRDEGWTLREYRKALPLLQLMSSSRPYGQVEEEEVQILRDKIEELKAEIAEASSLGERLALLEKRVEERLQRLP